MNSIKLLVDSPNSWMTPFAKKISQNLFNQGLDATFIDNREAIGSGWILFLLSCSKKLENLDLFTHNIVILASDLPIGRGWSPITWQILEGKNSIPISVFEANEGIDSGPIYFKDKVTLEGHELIDEIRGIVASKIEQLILKFINQNPKISNPQKGEPTYYSRRVPLESKLDINHSIKQQFNLLRVCDNSRYPAFFNYKGEKYLVKIFKEKNV